MLLRLACLWAIIGASYCGAMQTWLTGDAADVTTTTTQGSVLMGGGSDVLSAFQWMTRKSGGGDFVVIRASGSNGYNDWVYNTVGGVNSIETLLFESRTESSDSTVVRKIRNAEALFMAGGDQAAYVDYWKDTPVENAINYLIKVKKVPVGGTSAGCAIMTPCYFGATAGAPTSDEALADPMQSSISNGIGIDDFLDPPYLANTISDMHYLTRMRQGRHVAFMACLATRGVHDVKGIAEDEATAVCIDSDGKAYVYGSSTAFFLRQYCQGPETCRSGQPLTWQGGVKVYKVAANTTGNRYLDLKDWQAGSGGTWEYWTVRAGTLTMGTTKPFACATPVVAPPAGLHADGGAAALPGVWTSMLGRIMPPRVVGRAVDGCGAIHLRLVPAPCPH